MAGNPQLKVFTIPVDLKQPCSKRPVEVVDGDTGNLFELTLTDGGEALSADGLRVMAVFSSSRGVSVQDSEDGSIGIDGNVISIALMPASFAPGPVECELQLYSSSDGEDSRDVLVTTARFNFSCRAAMLNEDAVHSFPQFPVLTGMLDEIEAAEAERQAAEAERREAEAARQEAEEAREAAEEAREERMDELAAYVGVGAKAVNAAPGSSDGDALGRIYVVRNGNAAYICTAMFMSGGGVSFDWRRLAFESPWTQIKTVTLSADTYSVSIDTDQNGASFLWDELMLTITGTMKNTMIGMVYVNGSSKYIKDTSFMTRDAAVPGNNICRVYFRKMEEGFAPYERSSGGTADNGASSSSKTPQTAYLKLGTNAKYSGITVTAGVDSGRIGSGAVLTLCGRNID